MLCGGLAGSVGIFTTYPLDLVRARRCVQTDPNAKTLSLLQSFKAIIREEGGVRGLYRGCGVAIAERFPNMAVNFAAYDMLRNKFAEYGIVGLFPSLLNGALAGAISSSVTFPLDVVMRNLQVSKQFDGPLACARDMYKTHGLSGFYRGLSLQLLKAIPYTTVAWASYDFAKSKLHFEVC